MVYNHNINPIALTLFSDINIYWYGILYACGLLGAIYYIKFLDSKKSISGHHIFSNKAIDDLTMYMIAGIILGARILYVSFYHPEWILNDFLRIFKIRLGGLSFHGGLIGAGIALYLFIKMHQNELFIRYYEDGHLSSPNLNYGGLSITDYLSYNRKLLQYIEQVASKVNKETKLNLASRIRTKMLNIWLYILDLGACAAPIGLLCGRIGNFINGELYGRVSDGKFGVIFRRGDVPRHPSQLYEAFFEGIVLFIILNLLRFSLKKITSYIKKRYNIAITIKNGFLFGVFCLLYGLFRIVLEIYREPDAHIGLILNYFTIGQLLTMPMIPIGLAFIFNSLTIQKSQANPVV